MVVCNERPSKNSINPNAGMCNETVKENSSKYKTMMEKNIDHTWERALLHWIQVQTPIFNASDWSDIVWKNSFCASGAGYPGVETPS